MKEDADTSYGVAGKIQDTALLHERQEELVRSATRLFLSKGFHKTTVRDIASALGWNMGTLYLYIAKKEDVLFLIHTAIQREILASLPQEVAIPPKEALEKAMRAYFAVCDRMRAEINLLYREWASMETPGIEYARNTELTTRNYFAAIIRHGIQTGDFRPVDEQVVAYNVILLAEMWALKRWALAPRVSHELFTEMQMDAIFTMLSPRGLGTGESGAAAVGSVQSSD